MESRDFLEEEFCHNGKISVSTKWDGRLGVIVTCPPRDGEESYRKCKRGGAPSREEEKYETFFPSRYPQIPSKKRWSYPWLVLAENQSSPSSRRGCLDSMSPDCRHRVEQFVDVTEACRPFRVHDQVIKDWIARLQEEQITRWSSADVLSSGPSHRAHIILRLQESITWRVVGRRDWKTWREGERNRTGYYERGLLRERCAWCWGEIARSKVRCDVRNTMHSSKSDSSLRLSYAAIEGLRKYFVRTSASFISSRYWKTHSLLNSNNVSAHLQDFTTYSRVKVPPADVTLLFHLNVARLNSWGTRGPGAVVKNASHSYFGHGQAYPFKRIS